MKILTIMALVLVLASCSQDEAIHEYLEGYHSLNSVSCECNPIDITPHQQQWFFDFENSTINVKVSGEVKSHLVLKEGVYDFQIIEDEIIFLNDSTDLIKVGGHEFGFVENNSIISLSSGAPEGIFDLPTYTFIKY